MKIVLIILLSTAFFQSNAQQYEIEQLLLDVEKLAQFKEVLQNMYDTYTMLEQGYNQVRDIASGNFDLHKAFLDGLMAVSPTVKRYYRITEIIQMQAALIKEYRSSWKMFQSSDLFNPDELNFIEKVYKDLVNQSVQNLNALLSIVTANQLRMTDDERINAIDHIHQEISGELLFLRHFNASTHQLALQRLGESTEIQGLKKLHGIN